MQTYHSSSLLERVGPDAAMAIAEAYAAVISMNVISYDDRLAMIEALIYEADAGRAEIDHLNEVAGNMKLQALRCS